jgi:uncharacterized integral membrane protein (TIGR00698 family)
LKNVIANRFKELRGGVPGIALCIVIALAAAYLSEHYNGPAMLFALLLGMAFNPFADNPSTKIGISISSKTILRIGVALLGARITFESISSLGVRTITLVIGSVVLTIVVGYAIARALKLSPSFAIISASAVAICGASAALAVASVLPRSEQVEHSTTLSVVAVTTLSTIAMLVYPIIISSAGMNDHLAGIFLGATIHDVAQVVGAGYTISVEAGDTSAIVKLLRVSCLFPAVVVIGLAFGRRGKIAQSKTSLVPWFLVLFAVFVALGSFGLLSADVQAILSDASRWCLLIAVSALGARTSLQALTSVGASPMIAIVTQTLLLAIFVYVMLVTA